MDASSGQDADEVQQTPAAIDLTVPRYPDAPDRDVGQSIWRGWRRRCPACGTGPMMKGYLSVRDTCTVCSEELHHHRADDGPAWMTMLVVGHLMAPILGAVFMAWRPDPMVLTAAFSIGTVALALWLLPRFKGIVVAFQWAKRMHGFDPDADVAAGAHIDAG